MNLLLSVERDLDVTNTFDLWLTYSNVWDEKGEFSSVFAKMRH